MSSPGLAESATGWSATSLLYMTVIPLLTAWYFLYRYKHRRYFELADKIPGPPGLPLIGNALQFLGSAPTIFSRIYSLRHSYESVARLWIGTRMVCFLWDPRDIELILGSQVHLDKAPEYSYFKPWLGDGLLISSGNHWRSHRKLIAPTFHLNVLKSFIGLFNKNSRDTCIKMSKHNGKEFDAHDYMSECTVEILLETAMGVNKKTQDASGFDYAMAVMKMCNILHLRQARPWLRADLLFNLTSYKKQQDYLLNVIHSLTRKVIKKKKEQWAAGVKGTLTETDSDQEQERENEKEQKTSSERAASSHSYGQAAGLKDDLDVDDGIGEKKRVAFLDLMLESAQNGVVMNDNDIKEEVDTIMFEGHDTTAAGSSFFLSMMGLRQDIQDRVIQELDEIFGDSDRPATFQDTLEMKYLERCIMETLRMYPPVPIIAREVKEEVKLASRDLTIPAGTTVIIATFRLHRDENIYPNAEHFDPDNFLPEKAANRHYYAFIPFSAGPRSCVGRKYAMLKLKIILSTIMRQFRVKADIPEEKFQLQADIILKRAEGFRVRLEPRRPTLFGVAA